MGKAICFVGSGFWQNEFSPEFPPLVHHPLPPRGIFEYLITMYQGGFPIGFPFLTDSTSREFRTNSQPDAITAPMVAIERKVNLNEKICLCTEVSSFWLCMCCYNFKDYLVYFLQVNSLTCPLRPGFLLLPAHVKKCLSTSAENKQLLSSLYLPCETLARW